MSFRSKFIHFIHSFYCFLSIEIANRPTYTSSCIYEYVRRSRRMLRALYVVPYTSTRIRYEYLFLSQRTHSFRIVWLCVSVRMDFVSLPSSTIFALHHSITCCDANKFSNVFFRCLDFRRALLPVCVRVREVILCGHQRMRWEIHYQYISDVDANVITDTLETVNYFLWMTQNNDDDDDHSMMIRWSHDNEAPEYLGVFVLDHDTTKTVSHTIAFIVLSAASHFEFKFDFYF